VLNKKVSLALIEVYLKNPTREPFISFWDVKNLGKYRTSASSHDFNDMKLHIHPTMFSCLSDRIQPSAGLFLKAETKMSFEARWNFLLFSSRISFLVARASEIVKAINDQSVFGKLIANWGAFSDWRATLDLSDDRLTITIDRRARPKKTWALRNERKF
jgi:hypothetical protein